MPPASPLLAVLVALVATLSLQGCGPRAPAASTRAAPAAAPTTTPTSPAVAAAATQPATRPAAVRAEVTRRDVAEALMRFETALYTRERTPAEWAAVNKRFDAATTAFFAGGLGRVVKALDEMAWELDPATAPKTPAERAARAFKVRVEPGVATFGPGVPMAARPDGGWYGLDAQVIAFPMYPLPEDAGAVDLTVKFEHRDRLLPPVEVRFKHGQRQPTVVPFEVGVGPQTLQYDIRVSSGQALTWSAGVWLTRPKTSESFYDALIDRVSNVPEQPPALRNALATFKARVRVLRTWPNDDRSAVFQADPQRLRLDLPREADVLIRHDDPYRRRTGDFWRVAAGGGYVIPLRVYAPAAAADDTPRPLLVVLHGMGGDENMFLDAYGRGRIKALADQHGFVVASPNAYQISGKPELFYEVLEAMTLNYSIDPKRVYVLGHSMGAMAAGRIASRPGAVAAAVLIAGPAPDKVPADAAPMLLIAGDADRIVPAPRVRQSVERLKAAGRSVEYREKAGWGHTLVVPEVLPEAVEWLLSKR